MPAGRPRKPDSLTSTERNRARRSGLQLRTLELPGDVMDALAAIRQRDGDPSNVATATRLILRAANRP